MAKCKARLWQMTAKQYEAHREKQWQRSLRKAGMTSSDRRFKHGRKTSLWKRLDKVKDPKSAFFYLLDNVAGNNGGKLLNDFHARGKYFWYERNRDRDQAYYLVKKEGNFIVVTRTRWVVDGEGVNTFLGSLVGFKKDPEPVREVILRHPIMEVTTFQDAYKAVAPDLGWWDD